MITLNSTIQAYLAETLSAKRVAHILRVAETARELAARHGVDADRAYIAAMLHDVARETPGHRLLDECRKRGVDIMPIDEVNPMPRLHGRLGALLARERFGIDDPEILEAIASHTLGRVGMSPLEMVVFLSDYTEPGREAHNGLEEVREAAHDDLSLATRLAMDYTIRHLVNKRRSLHPQMVEARNWILTRSGEAPQPGGS
ncbi:MAG TPA: bis(5'-nucleosyl)-tetraphosphatase (symmetrical) YqeK [Pantanalinema sp.]